jgi:hypothetical protein
VQPSGLRADFDADADVDGADFLIWQRRAGTALPNGAPADGDADGDSDVDVSDLAAWRNQFGTASPAGAGIEQPRSQSIRPVTLDFIYATGDFSDLYDAKEFNWPGAKKRIRSRVI